MPVALSKIERLMASRRKIVFRPYAVRNTAAEAVLKFTEFETCFEGWPIIPLCDRIFDVTSPLLVAGKSVIMSETNDAL